MTRCRPVGTFAGIQQTFPHSPDPAEVEASELAALAGLRRSLAGIGELRLLYGLNPLARLAGTGSASGALSPDSARSLTRKSRRLRRLHTLRSRQASQW